MAAATACLWGGQAAALGLGRLAVQSALGETLRAEIEVTAMSPEEAASLKLRVAPPEAYRAAGVEYNAVLPSAQVQVVKRADGRTVLRVSSERAVLEPFVDVIVEATWASGRLVREYTMLFDPPGSRQAAAAPSASPVIERAQTAEPAPAPSPAAVAAPVPAQAPAAGAATTPTAPRAAVRPAQKSAPGAGVAAGAAPAAGVGAQADEYRVQRGDSLSRIAGRTQRQGVSLDQMLVSLFRANPQAFIAENMNRLKSGSVLSVPSAAVAGQVAPQEARELIVAQSADFEAYRQRLASGAPAAAADDTSARRALGTVQTRVDDRSQSAAAAPDRLKLSKGSVAAPAAEVKVSKDSERKDSSTRVAELQRNVQELKKLQGAAPAVVAPAATPAPAVVAKPAVAVPTPAVVATPPAPVAAKVAPVATPVASTAPVAATPRPAVASAPVAVPDAVAADEGPGFLDSLLDNSLLMQAAGVVVVLLASLGLYRMRGRLRKPAGETSFLESRLQPDSFFGASGGQRIDTRDGAASSTNNSSSMSYSLSQLDAIGDVDPVAEADVYLAYGRDLQAEEILKEAMRSNPERMAIRAKLLEVYAKRRDTKGFELLASQMFNLTHGEGADWTAAQALGLTIDPENPLYQTGGQPEEVRGARGQLVEPLGASTVPYTAPPAPPAFEPAADAKLDISAPETAIDLDLEFSSAHHVDTPEPAPTLGETTHPLSTAAALGAGSGLDLDLGPSPGQTVPTTVAVARAQSPALPAAAPVPPTVQMPKALDEGLDFDLDAFTTGVPPMPPAAAAPDAALDFGDFGVGSSSPPEQAAAGTDPLARKLELAEEFRQIGDLEGARDLLEEVVAKAGGALQAKAQGMLDKLG